MARVLIIDDEVAICRVLSDMVKRMGHEPATAKTLKEGVSKAFKEPFDVVLLDVALPDGSGLDVIPKLRETVSLPEVVIITGAGDPTGAEMAIRNGAWDYLQKPLFAKDIYLALNRVIQYRKNVKSAPKSPVALNLDGIVGNSPRIRACFDFVAQAANSDANVLITGETGTGKELFARAIHENGPRSEKSFVVVDCAALPESLVESSLFGYEKGAFTGADRARDGLILQADGGTLFLDEVGELPMSMQKAFLRVLQERRFRPIGGRMEKSSDFRLIAATNRDLDQGSKTGEFRKDLLFRIRSLLIEIPPLRERREDIKDLALYYITKICERQGTEIKGFSPEFFEALTTYNWPGNVRELIHTLEGAIAEAGREPTLFPKHLPSHIRIQLARASVTRNKKRAEKSDPGRTIALPPFKTSYKNFRESVMAEAEKHYFRDLMEAVKGSISEACRISGLGRTRLYSLLKKHGIDRSEFSAPGKNLRRE
ncbi:MAG: sigma-54-dependent Fis family transcriptional regulator [Deltaproteobacteria bacterium]|nr:sigma-54-dependent Fis family transcriptional regulator [Deltaproteobacteria bacterium]MBW2017629.1 sigma-54-dependent Fis family transcriptional regulator [Deltaproteobacteria bacterium]MBW2130458.1 sigma-54-dependent Fis family transcriptional regulator [Deltaproteobacteria bacterium]MBW2303590.1 sigma-54-dependent Fis family transcriptional regulator [Deltaproteobacteria bacterium]